jgi:molecular chaperone GrpE
MSDKKKDIVEDETDDNQEQELERQEKIDDEFDAEVAAENSENMESKEVDVEFLQGQLEKLQEQSKVSLDKVVRAQAEMENLRKRAARDVENAHKYALEKFTDELLPIMDSLELGLSASVKAKNLDDLCKGMELTLEMFNTVMEKFGITMIEPKGEKFNPELHDAVSMQETDDSNSGIIIEVMQKGYTLNGRLIRPAMVVVAK